MTRANVFRLVPLLLIVACAPARAHDPLDITAQVRLLPGGIAVRLTLAWSAACRLLAGGKQPVRWLPPEKFGEIRPLLQTRAPRFFALADEGNILAPRAVGAELTDDGDVTIRLEFPAARAARVRIDAALLTILGSEGYTVILTVLGPREGQVGHELLTLEKPGCAILAAGP